MHTALPLSHDQLLRLTNRAAARLRAREPEHELLRFAAAIEAGTPLTGALLQEFVDRFKRDATPKTLHKFWLNYYRRLEEAVAALPPQLPVLVEVSPADQRPFLRVVPDPAGDGTEGTPPST